MSAKPVFQKSLFALLVFYSISFLAFVLIEYFLSGSFRMADSGLLNWDAKHYFEIREHGYRTGMVAFFPMFPLIWKWIHLGNAAISIFNGLLFICSLSWLASVFEIRLKCLLLLATIPAFIFNFLPYSEAVFFLAGTMILVGLKSNRFGLLLAGFILAGLTRPVATVFIPSLLAVFYFSRQPSYNLKKVLGLVAACLLTFGAVLLLQYIQTGEALSFFSVQKAWGNSLRLPTLPLDSWAGGFIVRLDALSFFFGIASLAALLYLFVRKVRTVDFRPDPYFVFALCYMAFLTVLVLFTRGGVLNSLNRYLFCSAFFTIALIRIPELKIFNRRNMLILFLASSVLWLFFSSFVHIQTFLKFEFLSLYLLLLFAMLSSDRRMASVGYYAVLSCNILLMLIYYHRFLNGMWVG